MAKGKRKMLIYDKGGYCIVHNTDQNSFIGFENELMKEFIERQDMTVGKYTFEVGKCYREFGSYRRTSSGFLAFEIEDPNKSIRYEGWFLELDGKTTGEPTKWLLFRIMEGDEPIQMQRNLFGNLASQGWNRFVDVYFALGILSDANEHLFTRNTVGSVRIILMDE